MLHNRWNNLTTEIRNSKSVSTLKKSIKCEKKENSLFSICDPPVAKLFTHLRLQFSHLNEHKFRHGFQDTINAMCACVSKETLSLALTSLFSSEAKTL